MANLIESSRAIQGKISYDEINDTRIQEAVLRLQKDGYTPVVVGKKEDLEKAFGANVTSLESYVIEGDENPTVVSAQLLAQGKVDGFISGAQNTTGDTLKALLKNVGRADGVRRVSGFFLMDTPLGEFLLADCAVQPNPSAEELAEIAYLAGKSAQSLGMEPRIAMLSFSTYGSAEHELTNKVVEATKLVTQRIIAERLNFQVAGEIQLDAAICPDVAEKKVGDKAPFLGTANVLVFPDLNSGNIGYKIMQRFSGGEAIGPIIQGLKKPGNDLSRGCSVEDIYKLHCMTLLQIKK